MHENEKFVVVIHGGKWGGKSIQGFSYICKVLALKLNRAVHSEYYIYPLCFLVFWNVKEQILLPPAVCYPFFLPFPTLTTPFLMAVQSRCLHSSIMYFFSISPDRFDLPHTSTLSSLVFLWKPKSIWKIGKSQGYFPSSGTDFSL